MKFTTTLSSAEIYELIRDAFMAGFERDENCSFDITDTDFVNYIKELYPELAHFLKGEINE